MEHTNGQPSLTTIQQCVVNALASGATLTDAAEAHGVHRVTIYRWIKNHKQFTAALHRARAEFVLARRDDMHHLSNRAFETLLYILDNPRSSPAVLLRTAIFILTRPQLPKTGWSMPEPAPNPDGGKLIDSAVLEQDYDSIPGLYNIENDPDEPEDPAATPPDPPPPPPADASPCNPMQPDPPVFEDDASATPSSPIPVPAALASPCNPMQPDSPVFEDDASATPGSPVPVSGPANTSP